MVIIYKQIECTLFVVKNNQAVRQRKQLQMYYLVLDNQSENQSDIS